MRGNMVREDEYRNIRLANANTEAPFGCIISFYVPISGVYVLHCKHVNDHV